MPHASSVGQKGNIARNAALDAKDVPAPFTDSTSMLRVKLKDKISQRAAESWVRTETPKHIGLMKQVEQMKNRATGMSKPERFFRLVAFNGVFFDAIARLKFLP